MRLKLIACQRLNLGMANAVQQQGEGLGFLLVQIEASMRCMRCLLVKQGGLLRYLVSFRNHNEFHEQCVERIYMDVLTRCKPAKLAVYARYTRRGGLDINPFRTSHPQALPANTRTARQ